jgi:hypothetical protein
MPRIYTSRSDPIDLCRYCFPKTETLAFHRYGHEGDGPDGRGNCFGYDAEHPDYVELLKRCDKCRRILESEDN